MYNTNFRLVFGEPIQQTVESNSLMYFGKWKELSAILFLCLSILISCGGKQRPSSNAQSASNTELTQGTGEGFNSSTQMKDNVSGNSAQAADSTFSANAVQAANHSEPYVNNRLRFANIKPILQNRCAACHNPVLNLPNMLEYPVIKERVDNGKLFERVVTLKDDPAKGMPLGNTTGMTDAERDLIKQWIQDGGLE